MRIQKNKRINHWGAKMLLHASNTLEENDMNHKALVVIDIQNDITKHYRDIIDRLNARIHESFDGPHASPFQYGDAEGR